MIPAIVTGILEEAKSARQHPYPVAAYDPRLLSLDLISGAGGAFHVLFRGL